MEIRKSIKLLILSLLLLLSEQESNKIVNNSYKGYGIFFYQKIDSGSIYEVIFIPFHFKNKYITDTISLASLEANADNIIFERGISMGAFRDEEPLTDVFEQAIPCGKDGMYCLAYVEFNENPQEEINKWYKKRGYTWNICLGNKITKVTYDPTEIYVSHLIIFDSLEIIK